MKIMVYGTLKQGKSAHHLMNGCTYLGLVRLDGYGLYGSSPAILPHPDCYVMGELYECDDLATLKRIDRYEGYQGPGHNNLYERTMVEVANEEGTITNVHVYVYNAMDPQDYSLNDLNNGEWNG